MPPPSALPNLVSQHVVPIEAKHLCDNVDEVDEPSKKVRKRGRKAGGEDVKGTMQDIRAKKGKGTKVSAGDMPVDSSDEGSTGGRWNNMEITMLLEWLLGADNTERYEKFQESPRHYLKKVFFFYTLALSHLYLFLGQ